MMTNTPTVLTRSPTSLRVSVGAPTIAPSKLIPTQLPSAIPTSTPSVAPTAAPSFQPSLHPTLQPSFAPTNSPAAAVGASSINSASNGQSVNSSTAIGVGIGCVILVIILVAACVFFTRKSKEKKTPYEIWSSHYSNKNKQNHIHPQMSVNEDIHHFYSKNNNCAPSQRPSINQNSVFTPHVSGRTSFRNSQIITQMGQHVNYKRNSLATTTRNSQPNYPL
jgi:hypothetical protein